MSEHGSFHYRLPVASVGTTEVPGFSLWHLTAAKMLSADAQADFLRQANKQSLNLLLDDLRESMTVFPSSYKVYWLENAPYRGSWTWSNFREQTAWRTPLQICDLVGLPLICWPGGQELVQRLHPVIAAANVASCQRIGLHIEDW